MFLVWLHLYRMRYWQCHSIPATSLFLVAESCRCRESRLRYFARSSLFSGCGKKTLHFWSSLAMLMTVSQMANIFECWFIGESLHAESVFAVLLTVVPDLLIQLPYSYTTLSMHYSEAIGIFASWRVPRARPQFRWTVSALHGTGGSHGILRLSNRFSERNSRNSIRVTDDCNPVASANDATCGLTVAKCNN